MDDLFDAWLYGTALPPLPAQEARGAQGPRRRSALFGGSSPDSLLTSSSLFGVGLLRHVAGMPCALVKVVRPVGGDRFAAMVLEFGRAS
ncbi:hypothetical protein ACH4F6_19255 [Streptomyces sp. NPDC017936]|uniref:hypothetical protein n=1 Tax=Streptomyces sp. NPDC017936 TaxID=3365016 RepID=UPI0037964754